MRIESRRSCIQRPIVRVSMLTERELEQLRLALEECRQQCANEAAIAAASACLKSFAPNDDELRSNAA
jgi:hypothetical protein